MGDTLLNEHAAREELLARIEEQQARIEELEMLNRELLQEREQETTLDYAWTGNLGRWYWNVRTNTVTFNPLKVTELGYARSELPEHVTYQFFTDKLHPDDYQRTMDAMIDHLAGRRPVYEVEYRIRAKDGTYKWYYDRGRVTQTDQDGKPAFLAGIVFDITSQKTAELELEQQNRILSEISSVDGLTRISNHRTLVECLKAETAQAKRTQRPLSLAMFDLDDFKMINDSRGHVFGDQVLTEAAALIRKCVRESDIPGRYGGEEFMVIFPGTDLDSAVKVSERIRRAIEGHVFAGQIKVTVSGGVRAYRGESVMDFIHLADANLYLAKRNGKNQIEPAGL